MCNLLWHSDDLKLGWNLGSVTNVWTSNSERNLYFRYLIRTVFKPAITQLLESARIFIIAFNLEELWSIYLALWWFEVRLKFGKCDKCLNVNFRTKSKLSILYSHIVGTGKDQFLESARILMIEFNLEELWSIYYGTLMIWS